MHSAVLESLLELSTSFMWAFVSESVFSPQVTKHLFLTQCSVHKWQKIWQSWNIGQLSVLPDLMCTGVMGPTSVCEVISVCEKTVQSVKWLQSVKILFSLWCDCSVCEETVQSVNRLLSMSVLFWYGERHIFCLIKVVIIIWILVELSYRHEKGLFPYVNVYSILPHC